MKKTVATASSIQEIVRRVEDAPLRELVSVDMDDVQVVMDQLIQPEVTYASLYKRWERQQWAVSDLDFSQDVTDWGKLQPGLQEGLQRTMTLFYIGEQAVTDTLSPILHAAPMEDERIFLATQIADEARHTVFFQRFFEEVFSVRGGLGAALAAIKPQATQGFRKIFDHELVDATERVRVNPKDDVAWVEAVVIYHIMIEGWLALNGQRATLRQLRAVGLMPGFVAGFTAVARDESRHLGFGVAALRRRVHGHPEMGRVVARKVVQMLEPVVLTSVNPTQKLGISDPREVPEALRVNSLELRDFALESLAKRLRAIGLTDSLIAEIDTQSRVQYEEAWATYERLHGVRHPARYWQEFAIA
jgi:ribonucleoside-diphosphate reductase beta chain